MTAKCPTLYILMRTDMASMNPGKGMAQAAHAANVFMFNHTPEEPEGFREWLGFSEDSLLPEEIIDAEVQRFGAGVTITLAVGSEKELREIIRAAREDGFPAALYEDISYPIRDGSVVHTLPVVTCGYVFTACRNTARPSCLSGLSLHP